MGPGATDADLGLNHSWNVGGTALTQLANFTPNMSGIPTLAGPWVADGPSLMPAFQIDGTIKGTQIPEPSTFWVLGAGVIGLVAMARRRMNSF